MAPSIAELPTLDSIKGLEKSNNKVSFDLFPQSRKEFSDGLFANPTSEYRGTPLWSWNTKLDEDQLMRQIDNLQEMGLGGFHMHSRVGLDTEYMGEEFMDLVKKCVERAKEKKLLAWLYDEDRWPSGAAGGLVTKDDDSFRARHMLITPWKYGDPTRPDQAEENHSCSAVASRSELGFLAARYSIVLDDDGFLIRSRRLAETEEDCEGVWYAYIETNPPSEWFNGSYYVDALSASAMKKFVDLTYEPYKKAVGHEFGKTIPSIFTDEPQFALKNQLKTAHGKRDIFLPWTLDLAETYEETYKADILDSLPEVVWDLRGPSKTRYNFHDHVCDRFVKSFIDQLGDWCNANGIALTGHMMKEASLRSQTSSLGEAMRCYRNMHLPGIDLLCDRREFTTAKQAQSVSRQYGRCGVLSEIYGVTNWTFTFEGHKGCGDWQAALGINVRCPHLAWVSMAGEAKRDYPAAIGYQSPWYKEYPLVETHFARVHTALTRGKPAVRVGVIHPIESFWLSFGPNETSVDQDGRDKQFSDIIDWLCYGLIDSDLISESLLPEQNPRVNNGKLSIGHMEYDAIIVPNLRTIRGSTLGVLRDFAKSNGKIIVAGEDASLVDVLPSTDPKALQAARVPFNQLDILHELDDVRDLKIILDSGMAADKLLYQMRIDGEERYLFICNTDRLHPRQCRVDIRGSWTANLLDTMSGKSYNFETTQIEGWTRFNYNFDGCASILLRLFPTSHMNALPLLERPKWHVSYELTDCNASLSEPNVLLLDIASHKVNDEKEWQSPEEVLRIDNIAREKLGLRLKKDAFAQPWTTAKTTPKDKIALRFIFKSEVDVAMSQIALENASITDITFDGKAVISDTTGWWVDESISTKQLPAFSAGEHELILTLPFDASTNIERVYILGEFGVDLRGRKATITNLELEKLGVGDYTRQGLPFYAGNVHYDFKLSISGSEVTRTAIQVPRFSAPLLAVQLDGKDAGKIAFQPHTLDLGDLQPGDHILRITAYGNRDHSFGAVHLPDGLTKWYGPDAFRTSGSWWSYEYTIREMGLLTAVRVLTTDENVARASGWDRGSIKGYL